MGNNVNFAVDKDNCIKCGLCKKDCPTNIIEMNDYPEIDTNKMPCIECRHCFAICPTGTISILGKNTSQEAESFNVDYNELKKLVRNRRSIRQYKDENVDKEVIDDLCKTALYAPTAKNFRNIHFTVIDDKEVLKKIRTAVYDKLSTMSFDDPNLGFFKMAIEYWNKEGKDKLFGGAPHLIAISEPIDAPIKTVDAIIAMSYFEILANAQGLGTMWDGLLNMLFNNIIPEFKKDLQIPENNKVSYVMVFGKPSIKYPRIVEKGTASINVVR
jgi:nitroreductase/NAD-dependent dihydropyrimidine dehydrogenase PreA subunit